MSSTEQMLKKENWRRVSSLKFEFVDPLKKNVTSVYTFEYSSDIHKNWCP